MIRWESPLAIMLYSRSSGPRLKKSLRLMEAPPLKLPVPPMTTESYWGTTRMRIPLKFYDQVSVYLERRSDVALEGIPEAHRKLAELHFQAQGDGEYPEPSELVEQGVPEHLASTLTGYQRQGVAFVLSREGKGKLLQHVCMIFPFSFKPIWAYLPHSNIYNCISIPRLIDTTRSAYCR